VHPGAVCRLAFTKWGDLPHWEMDCVWLGEDEHGTWLGYPAGTFMSRPGAEVTTTNPQVGLLPAAGTAYGQGWVATFHGEGGPVLTYVDMSTPARWDRSTIRAVDLDLDVVKPLDGEVYVDDEDEFEEHRVAYAYPDEIVELARASADVVLTGVRRGLPPFDGTHERWLTLLATL
jgi:uncharacterized protein